MEREGGAFKEKEKRELAARGDNYLRGRSTIDLNGAPRDGKKLTMGGSHGWRMEGSVSPSQISWSI